MNWRQAGANWFAVEKNRASAAIARVATDLHIARIKPLAKRFRKSLAGWSRHDDGSSIEPESKFLIRPLQLAVLPSNASATPRLHNSAAAARR